MGEPAHIPPEHTSPTVQAFPSSQTLVFAAWTQPDDGSQLSVVHTLPSSQLGGGPPWQTPPLQASFVVQAFPSLHEWVLFTCTQPVAGLHVSSVQMFASSQLAGPPAWQLPPPHTSPTVQALPSLQAAVLFVWTQPLRGLHVSSVHGLWSSQSTFTHWHASPTPS